MAKEVTMPLLSPSMTEGTLVKWLKKEGDEVKSGEVIAEVETDKATMDLEAFDAGVLRKILVPEGTRVPVNQRIGVIGTADEEIPADLLKVDEPAAPAPQEEETASSEASQNSKEAAPAAAPAPSATAAPAKPAAKKPTYTGKGRRLKVSPLARKVAEELGVPLGQVAGTGPGGRIVVRDIENFTPSSGGWGLHPVGPVVPEERIPASNVRQVIAKRLVESKTQLPHFYLNVEIDAGPLVELRAKLNETFAQAAEPFKLTFNHYVLKAAAEAVRAEPRVNASWMGDSIQQYGSVNVAFAVDTGDGLITPVIFDAQNKSLRVIAQEANELGKRGRDGKLKPEEFTGGTITVSNLGSYGVDQFNAIINPPQAMILAVGNIVKKPVVDANDNIVVGQRMNITLSGDHRVVDGAVGALYLKALRELLETPARLLL